MLLVYSAVFCWLSSCKLLKDHSDSDLGWSCQDLQFVVKRGDLSSGLRTCQISSNILTSISVSERNESIPPRRLDFCLLCLNLDLVSQSLRREPPHHHPLRVLLRHNSTNHPPGGARQLSRTYAAPHIGVSRQSYARRTCVRVRCPAQTDWRRWAQLLSAPLASPHTLLLCFHKPCFHQCARHGQNHNTHRHSWSQQAGPGNQIWTASPNISFQSVPNIGALYRM